MYDRARDEEGYVLWGRAAARAPAVHPRRTIVAGAALAAILALSAFLQFYRLDDLQHFQGDEGNLVLVARAMVLQHRFPAHGMGLSVGQAHLAPLYDYIIALPLWLASWNPTAGAALNGLCQLLAVILCYVLLARHGGGRLAGLVGALTLATAQEVVYYDRFLWPNMLPLAVLLIFWSLLALRDGRAYHLALLGVWLGIALQLQPTAVLLVPFLALSLALGRPPLRWRYAALGALALAALFAPAVAHDLTHHLEETRAWLSYRHHSGGSISARALGATIRHILVLLQRLVGIHRDVLAAALGVALAAGTAIRARDRRPGSAGPLARLILLYSGVYLAGYLFFGAQLRPHYTMPLFPIPALALGLLAGVWSPPRADGASGGEIPATTEAQRHGGFTEIEQEQRGRVGAVAGIAPWAGRAPLIALRAGVAALAVTLAIANVQHTWTASFMPDRFQITLLPGRSNRITLGEMRPVADAIARQAGNRRFNLRFIAPDDTPDAYEALLLARGARLSPHAAALQFLVVQPPDWRATRWPRWASHLAACAGTPPRRFSAALVWELDGGRRCD